VSLSTPGTWIMLGVTHSCWRVVLSCSLSSDCGRVLQLCWGTGYMRDRWWMWRGGLLWVAQQPPAVTLCYRGGCCKAVHTCQLSVQDVASRQSVIGFAREWGWLMMCRCRCVMLKHIYAIWCQTSSICCSYQDSRIGVLDGWVLIWSNEYSGAGCTASS